MEQFVIHKQSFPGKNKKMSKTILAVCEFSLQGPSFKKNAKKYFAVCEFSRRELFSKKLKIFCRV